ncbi:hypothetical protein KO361_03890 [Candidatus Woesearchaeota archaeon]|nr:hypothetical protein [Candidatus Woesearchaeota archaeon]
MVFGLFKKKKKIEVIHVQDIDSWIKKTFEAENLGLKIGILKRELNSKKAKIYELLEDLDKAELVDSSVIPERAKSIFHGNKKSYVQKISLFLDQLICPDDVSEIESFLEDVSLKLEDLAQETNKNYFIIKEFIEDDVRKVASKIKEIDDVVSSARSSVDKTPISKFRELKDLLSLYYDNVSKIDETKKLIEAVLERKSLEVERRKKVESKIRDLEKSPHFVDYSELNEKKGVVEENLKKVEYSVINLFSGISSVLKKYSKKKKNKLAASYSDNAVNALLSDSKLGILKVLEDVVKIKDSLDIKSTKLKKLDSEVDSISEKKLDKFRSELVKLGDDLNDLNNVIKNHSFGLNLKELKGRLDIINQNIVDVEREEQELEDVLERLNPRLVKQKMRDLIKSIREGTVLE